MLADGDCVEVAMCFVGMVCLVGVASTKVGCCLAAWPARNLFM